MSLIDSLGERVGPFPAWLWAVAIGGALYFLAHSHSHTSAPQGFDIPLNLGGMSGLSFVGTPALPQGPVLELNPMRSNGIGSQGGAVLYQGSSVVPLQVPYISGGNPPFTLAAGLPQSSPYTIARGQSTG